MTTLVEAQSERAKAQELRAIAQTLLHDRYNDWNDWEFDWLTDETARRAHYIYSDREWAVLNRLRFYSRSFAQYSDYSVAALTALAYAGRCDFDEDDQAFIEKVHLWRAVHLKRRQIGRLVSLCRLFESIDPDPIVDQEFIQDPESG